MDMRFFWVKDRMKQGQFHIYWRPGNNNRVDYFTKHHVPAYHKDMRSVYICSMLREYYSKNGGMDIFVARVC